MCFTNLPIAFDGDGRARLEDADGFAVPAGVPAAVATPAAAAPAPVSTDGHRMKELNLDPVTRVAGALAFHTTLDLTDGVVTDAHSEAVQFRGYELILQ